MTEMRLTYSQKMELFGIDEAEIARLLALHDAGEPLYYECDLGRVTLCGDVLTVENFHTVPEFFAVLAEDGYLNRRATFTAPLKARVRKVVFGEGTKIITYNSFLDFVNLREVVLPDSVERICGPFENCPKLKPYKLPKSLTLLWKHSYGIFPDEVVLPDGTENIGDFFTKSKVRAVTLPPALKRIEGHAFYRCENLTSVTFAEGLTSIGSYAFAHCKNLKSVVLPRSLSYIEDGAFLDCPALTEVQILGDTDMAHDAFDGTPFAHLAWAKYFDSLEPQVHTDPSSIASFALLKQTLAGKKLSEQVQYFKLQSWESYHTYSYGTEDYARSAENAPALIACKDVKDLIVCDGVVVGVVIYGVSVFVNTCTCVYSASEDDGAGRRECTDYRTLLFSPEKEA